MFRKMENGFEWIHVGYSKNGLVRYNHVTGTNHAFGNNSIDWSSNGSILNIKFCHIKCRFLRLILVFDTIEHFSAYHISFKHLLISVIITLESVQVGFGTIDFKDILSIV